MSLQNQAGLIIILIFTIEPFGKEQVIIFSMKNPAACVERQCTLTTEYTQLKKDNTEKTPLNEYTVKVIKGTRYKVRSIYVGDKDFQQLFEDIIVTKAVRQQKNGCSDRQNAV